MRRSISTLLLLATLAMGAAGCDDDDDPTIPTTPNNPGGAVDVHRDLFGLPEHERRRDVRRSPRRPAGP